MFKKARKATDAEWKLLARYEATKRHKSVAQIPENNGPKVTYNKREGYKNIQEEIRQDYSDEWVNPRLQVERSI